MDFLFALGAFHGLIFTATAVVIVYADHQGFLYFRGSRQTLSPAFLKWSHRLVWTGLLLMIFTGFLLAFPAWEYYLTQPAFLIKMGFVLTLLVNAFAIGTLSRKAGEVAFAELTKKEKTTLLVSGALSAIGWVGAASIGLLVL